MPKALNLPAPCRRQVSEVNRRRRKVGRRRSGVTRALFSAAALTLVIADPVWGEDAGLIGQLSGELQADFRYNYSWEPLRDIVLGFGVAAIVANGHIDDRVQEIFRDKLNGEAGGNVATFFNNFGDAAQPLSVLPIYLGAMWLGGYGADTDSGVARWGGDSLRAMLVASPQLVVLSHVSGGQRPEEGNSGWNEFEDDNGVSGHAFYGAVPILSAARLVERRWLKYSLYAVSTLPGFARVHSDKHYFSQSLMGWWLAYTATRSVQQTNRLRSETLLMPVALQDGFSLQLSKRF